MVIFYYFDRSLTLQIIVGTMTIIGDYFIPWARYAYHTPQNSSNIKQMISTHQAQNFWPLDVN